MEKQIVVVKPGTIKPIDKMKMAKNGQLVIEHPDPLSIVYRNVGEEMKFSYVNCANCGERIYFLNERLEKLKENGRAFYCTQGHPQSFTPKK